MFRMKDLNFFVPVSEPWREGYLVPVRNRLNNHIQREYIPSELKTPFSKKWGEEIIYDDVFLSWYCNAMSEI